MSYSGAPSYNPVILCLQSCWNSKAQELDHVGYLSNITSISTIDTLLDVDLGQGEVMTVAHLFSFILKCIGIARMPAVMYVTTL